MSKIEISGRNSDKHTLIEREIGDPAKRLLNGFRELILKTPPPGKVKISSRERSTYEGIAPTGRTWYFVFNRAVEGKLTEYSGFYTKEVGYQMLDLTEYGSTSEFVFGQKGCIFVIASNGVAASRITYSFPYYYEYHTNTSTAIRKVANTLSELRTGRRHNI